MFEDPLVVNCVQIDHSEQKLFLLCTNLYDPVWALYGTHFPLIMFDYFVSYWRSGYLGLWPTTVGNLLKKIVN